MKIGVFSVSLCSSERVLIRNAVLDPTHRNLDLVGMGWDARLNIINKNSEAGGPKTHFKNNLLVLSLSLSHTLFTLPGHHPMDAHS